MKREQSPLEDDEPARRPRSNEDAQPLSGRDWIANVCVPRILVICTQSDVAILDAYDSQEELDPALTRTGISGCPPRPLRRAVMGTRQFPQTCHLSDKGGRAAGDDGSRCAGKTSGRCVSGCPPTPESSAPGSPTGPPSRWLPGNARLRWGGWSCGCEGRG